MPGDVRLIPVGPAESEAVALLRLGDDQHDLMASNVESLEEADDDDEARPRAIVADGRIVGFLMYEAPDDEDWANIYRFMIDVSEQGRGLGRAALGAVLAEIATFPHVRRVEICYMPENEAARRLYAAAGFREIGLDEDGEMLARLDLGRAETQR